MDFSRSDVLSTPIFNDDCSDEENSKDGLEIVISESPKDKTLEKMNPEEKMVIESIEDKLEEELGAKAAKSKLTATNVKNILKHVLTNEHVVTMVRQSIGDNLKLDENFAYEPKLTRAKAKELFPEQSTSIPHWMTPSPPSEHHILINRDLSEDSSGDEYIPGDDEIVSEDEFSAVSTSDADSQPRTPAKPKRLKKKATDCSTQTVWSNDGMFKIPKTKEKSPSEDAEMIALRTRSKVSLHDTPLEIIEGAFVPPDVTTDMYDFDCDDEDWKDFLKKFTRPLDEAVTGGEDEETDPEYNVLADEEMETIDKEELRADKAVTVPRKELNALIAELYEFTDAYTKYQQKHPKENSSPSTLVTSSASTATPSISTTPPASHQPQPEFVCLQNISPQDQNISVTDAKDPLHIDCSEQPTVYVQMEPQYVFDQSQKMLLEQQMRQHVQILTQNFLLTFHHPELWKISKTFRDNLTALHNLAGNKTGSFFNAYNLSMAMDLVKNWENKAGTEKFGKMVNHMIKVVRESKESKNAGNSYELTFPPLVLEAISNSSVFLYPSLLPRMPFKCMDQKVPCFESENELIAIGLEQFIPFLEKDAYHLSKLKQVKLYDIAYTVCQYLLPAREPHQMQKHIKRMKEPRCNANPIKYYYENGVAPTTVHYVVPLSSLGICPPKMRSKESLPHQWRIYIYGSDDENESFQQSSALVNNISKIGKPPAFNKNVKGKRTVYRQIYQKSSSTVQKRTSSSKKTSRRRSRSLEKFVTSSPKSISLVKHNNSDKKLEEYFQNTYVSPIKDITLINPSLRTFKFNSSVFQTLSSTILEEDMLPSMPFLSTPMKEPSDSNILSSDDNSEISKLELALSESSTTVSAHENETEHQEHNKEDEVKDNEDELNALMVASSTIKSGKRPASGTDRKKAKLKKEYNASLAMLSPEDPDILKQKSDSLSQAFYDKLQEKLDPVDYQQVLKVLHDFNALVENVSELYTKIESIIGEKHPGLCEEFLIFLTPYQANELGKFLPHFLLTNMSLFLRKLEVFYNDQPAQLKKIFNAIVSLSTKSDVNMDLIKSTILPLLKGNKLLTDWFLQIFPSENPPECLLDGVWEQMDHRQLEESEKFDGYEYITVPEVEDPYGGPNCICKCHDVDEEIFKNRSRHCVPCGTKFLQGRVYVQTGKGLRIANVSFNNGLTLEQLERLSVKPVIQRQKRRSETITSPSKHNTSPTKDGQEEPRLSNESEDDLDCKKSSKTPRTPKSPRKKKTAKSDKNPEDAAKRTKSQARFKLKLNNSPKHRSSDEKDEKLSPSAEEKSNTETEETLEMATLPSKSDSVADNPEMDAVEWECNTSIESVDIKSSPAHDTESVGDEFLEESSQDNIATESDGTIESDIETTEENSEQENGSEDTDTEDNGEYEDRSWTKEEDKIILQTFREEGDNNTSFEKMKQLIPAKSIAQLRQRFNVLMSLLRKMACDS